MSQREEHKTTNNVLNTPRMTTKQIHSPQTSILNDPFKEQQHHEQEQEAVNRKEEQLVHIIPSTEKIVPPLNFCPVERYLYRSGQPSPVNFPFLSSLNLRTIIWLNNEDPQDSLLEFCDYNDIFLQFAAINPDGGEDDNPWDGLNEKSISNALKTLVNKENYPLLVCCGMGRHRTGTVIGCLRRIMKWNLASCSEEYRRFTGSRGGRILVELLIEGFDTSKIEINEATAPEFMLNALR